VTRLGLGLVGAGRFAGFLADAWRELPEVGVRVVADLRLESARALAERYDAKSSANWKTVLWDEDVDVVVIATPPADHFEIVRASLEAGRHVFCEKPLAVDDRGADELVALVERTPRVLVVDHVLRYNPILRGLTRLGESPTDARLPGARLLGPLQRFCFENDASDEDLDPGHWFWDESRSGGIFVEHGVHFFDAAAMLVGRPATSVQASAARRRYDGPVDLVSATATHGTEVLATHTHGFTHAHRCERQLMRLDYGPLEARVEGWIPVDAVIDGWTDDDGVRVAESLPDRTSDLLHVDGFRLGSSASVSAEVSRDCGPPQARGRGEPLTVPHHVRLRMTLGGPAAKASVYAESVRAAMTDLVTCATTGGRPLSGVDEGAAAVRVAAAARRSAAESRTITIGSQPRTPQPSTPQPGTRTAT
jgi:predicted dehydrogenase